MSVDTTKREVEEHESKDNPHADSASATAFNDHENSGNPHADSASATALNNHENAGNPHSDSASKADLHDRYTDSEARSALPKGDAVELPTYATESDLPNVPEGSIAYVSGTGGLYVEDGS